MRKRTSVRPIQGNVIRQWEIAALYHLEDAREIIALDFKRRLESGARVEAGEYSLKASAETADTVAEEINGTADGGGFNCSGFDSVAWTPRRPRKQTA